MKTTVGLFALELKIDVQFYNNNEKLIPLVH